MYQIKFLIALLIFCLFGFTSIAQANTQNIQAKEDTTVTVSIKNDQNVQIVRNDKPIIIRKGEKLTLKIENPSNAALQVRVHSSLGRLVKQFLDVFDEVVMSTDKLLPGVYMIIIKKDDTREIRKVMITD